MNEKAEEKAIKERKFRCFPLWLWFDGIWGWELIVKRMGVCLGGWVISGVW